MRRFSVSAPYDPALDLANTKEGRKMMAILKNATPKQRELWRERAAQKMKNKKHTAIRAAKVSAQERREKAEEEVAETVRVATRAMQQALLMLQDVPTQTNWTRKVNVLALHNLIIHIKTKCGVYFPPDEIAELPKRLGLDTGKTYVPWGERPENQ